MLNSKYKGVLNEESIRSMKPILAPWYHGLLVALIVAGCVAAAIVSYTRGFVFPLVVMVISVLFIGLIFYRMQTKYWVRYLKNLQQAYGQETITTITMLEHSDFKLRVAKTQDVLRVPYVNVRRLIVSPISYVMYTENKVIVLISRDCISSDEDDAWLYEYITTHCTNIKKIYIRNK